MTPHCFRASPVLWQAAPRPVQYGEYKRHFNAKYILCGTQKIVSLASVNGLLETLNPNRSGLAFSVPRNAYGIKSFVCFWGEIKCAAFVQNSHTRPLNNDRRIIVIWGTNYF